MVSTTLIIVLAIVVLIWLSIEFRKFKHKIFAIFLILLILSFYFSFSAVIKGKNLDLKSFEGMKQAGKLYFLWVGNAFKNVKVVTSNVIDMNWGFNSSTPSPISSNETNSTNLTKI